MSLPISLIFLDLFIYGILFDIIPVQIRPVQLQTNFFRMNVFTGPDVCRKLQMLILIWTFANSEPICCKFRSDTGFSAKLFVFEALRLMHLMISSSLFWGAYLGPFRCAWFAKTDVSPKAGVHAGFWAQKISHLICQWAVPRPCILETLLTVSRLQSESSPDTNMSVDVWLRIKKKAFWKTAIPEGSMKGVKFAENYGMK